MEIAEIKTKLSLSEIIKHYGYAANKQNRINCPFHDDKTPSMQLYWRTDTAYCFSSNCKLKGKGIDVIDFVMYKENITKHQAIEKCKTMVNPLHKSKAVVSLPPVYQNKEQFLQRIFIYFKNGVYTSNPAKEYINQRNLDFKKLEKNFAIILNVMFIINYILNI